MNFINNNMIWPGPILDLFGYNCRTQSGALSCERKYYNYKLLKIASVKQMQAYKVPFFSKNVPKEMHPCPQCLE